jgi:cell division protein FtsB
MDRRKMKLINLFFVFLFLVGCNNNDQSWLVLIKEKDQEIEQLKTKNAQMLEEISQKDLELKDLKSKKSMSKSKDPQNATLKDGTKILAYEWEIAPKEIFNIPVGDSYFVGAKDAKVTVMEWMDYQ